MSGKKEPKTKREHPDAEDAAEYAKGEGDDAENAIASVASDVAKDVNGNEKKSGDDYMSSRNVYVLIYRSAKGLALGPDIDKDGGVADVFSIISSQLSQEEVQKVRKRASKETGKSSVSSLCCLHTLLNILKNMPKIAIRNWTRMRR